jgi:hypothetical protein
VLDSGYSFVFLLFYCCDVSSFRSSLSFFRGILEFMKDIPVGTLDLVYGRLSFNSSSLKPDFVLFGFCSILFTGWGCFII